jgi:NH3-dependent NAD+ synthetase
VPDDEAPACPGLLRGLQHPGLRARAAAARHRRHPARKPIVIGVSGGLDSTHALIVAAKAWTGSACPRTDILGFTMPGFATSAGTKNNAIHLMESLGITWEELDIRPAATQMLKDLGHPFGRGEEVYDVTFENVQAGLRTDYLFRLANQRGGIVLGTGDLSELALGWCTYGVGDQMSHYGVNTGVPKTLMQHLIRWVVVVGTVRGDGQRRTTCSAILDTEISPELVPTKEGEKPQSPRTRSAPTPCRTSRSIHVLRRGYRPSKIAFLACTPGRRRERASGRRVTPRPRHGIRPGDDPRWMRRSSLALLRQPVQALGDAQRAQGRPRWRDAVAARRLADAVGRQTLDALLDRDELTGRLRDGVVDEARQTHVDRHRSDQQVAAHRADLPGRSDTRLDAKNFGAATHAGEATARVIQHHTVADLLRRHLERQGRLQMNLTDPEAAGGNPHVRPRRVNIAQRAVGGDQRGRRQVHVAEPGLGGGRDRPAAGLGRTPGPSGASRGMVVPARPADDSHQVPAPITSTSMVAIPARKRRIPYAA